MKLKTIHLAALAAISLASNAHAVTVTWGTATDISSSTEVSTLGTQVFGRSISTAYGTSASIVNGADFGFNNPNWTVTFTDGFPVTATLSLIPALSGPDGSNYQNVLSIFRDSYPSSSSGSFSFGNLTEGQEYQIQFWAADYRNFTNVRTQTLTAAGDSASPALPYLNSNGTSHGQFILGTFTADATQTVSFTVASNEYAQYNAIQLRAIPEPSAALLGSFGVLCLLRRRRA